MPPLDNTDPQQLLDSIPGTPLTNRQALSSGMPMAKTEDEAPLPPVQRAAPAPEPKPAITLDAIRQKYPQYNDMPDDALAQGLHKKFYGDMSFEEFAGKIGYAPNPGIMQRLGKAVQNMAGAPARAEAAGQGAQDVPSEQAPTDRPPQPGSGAAWRQSGAGPVATAARDAFGDEPLGLSDKTAAALQRAGVFPDPNGGLQPLKQINEALIRPVAAMADAFVRAGSAGFGAAQQAAVQAGTALGLTDMQARTIASMPEAFFGSPDNFAAEHRAFDLRNAHRSADMAGATPMPDGKAALADVAAGHPTTDAVSTLEARAADAAEHPGAPPQAGATLDALPTLQRMAAEAAERPSAGTEIPAAETQSRPAGNASRETPSGAEPTPPELPQVTVTAKPPEVAQEPPQEAAQPAPEAAAAPAEPEAPTPAQPAEAPAEAAPARASREPTPFETVPREPQRLIDFLRRDYTIGRPGDINAERRPGGIQDPNGDIRAIIGGVRGRPTLINKNGSSIRDAMMRAWNAGYFPEFEQRGYGPEDDQLLKDRIEQDHNGHPVYSEQDLDDAQAYQAALANNEEINRLATEHGIPTHGLTRDQFFDQAHDRMSLDERASEAQSQAEAHQAAYDDAERRTREFLAQHGVTALEPADIYAQSQARTLEDMEREYQSEEAASAAQQRAPSSERLGPAAADQRPVPEGGQPRDSGAGPTGRGEAESAQAPTDLLGRPLAAPRERAQEATLRTDTRQTALPGTEASAVQAQAARDAQGRGALQTDVTQRPANEGLFAPDTSGQATLYSFPAALFDPQAWRRAFGPLAPVSHAVRESSRQVAQSIADGLAPIQSGSKRAQAFAADFANSLRRVQYRYGQIDKEIERAFTPTQRDQMGRALDAQSVFEQTVRDLPAERQASARAEFDNGRSGLAGLNEKQRQAVDALDAISQDVWRRMQDRGLVDPNARPLPYYMPRQIVMWSDAEGFKRAGGEGGAGRGLEGRGANLTTAGPMRREHLTPEETEAAARAKLGAGAQLLRDIRSLPARLAFSERAITGVDLMSAIDRVGKDTGVDLVVKGDIPGMLEPGAFFTMADHPSFRQWNGTGWQAIHVSKEFEGPLKAVLTKASPTWYKAAQMLKGGVMSAIMYSPFIHLAVELGRALPVMPGRILTLRALRDGSSLRRDLGYMDQATKDGLAPLGQGWHADPVSIADATTEGSRNSFVRAIQQSRDAIANGARAIGGETLHDIVQHPHQALLWDQVFNLQVGIYNEMRRRWIDKGFDPPVAGTMAAHIANRYAGALPPEHLSRAANMASNLLLFSRSFTLGNLGVMKDMLSGAPSHVRARIEQMAGPDAANAAQSAMRRKAITAFTMDIALFYMANGLLQAGIQTLRGSQQQGLPAAAQQTYQQWLDEAGTAMSNAKENPLEAFGVLPQHWNEPGKQDRVYAGTDATGRGVYLRLPPGKVGEEFLGWFAKPGVMVTNKMSPLVRPIIEDIMGHDTLGRQLFQPNPRTIGDYLDIAKTAAMHVVEGLGPTSTIQGAHEIYQHYVQGQPSQGDPLVSWAKVIGPATGLAQVSQGYPGGPAAGEIHAQTERQRFEFQKALPDIRRKIVAGDEQGARADMTALGVAPGLQRYYVRQAKDPGVSGRQMQRFRQFAPSEVRDRAARQSAP